MHFFVVQVEVQVDAWLMHGSDLLVQVYSGISHSDSVTVVPSFYFYFRVAGWGKDRSKKKSRKEGAKPKKASRWMRRSGMTDKQGIWIEDNSDSGKIHR
jgi:hypothetical protein